MSNKWRETNREKYNQSQRKHNAKYRAKTRHTPEYKNKQAEALSKLGYSRRKKINAFKLDIGCQINNCGYNQCAAALDFHHVNPDEKSFSVSRSVTLSISRIRQEIAKCCVLCSNHHREFHDGLIPDLPEPLADKALELSW